MRFMAGYHRRFEALKESGRLDSALVRWKARHTELSAFADSEAFVRDFKPREQQSETSQRMVLQAVASEAVRGDEEAFLLLVGLYLNTFRQLRREIGHCLLDEQELEAEMLAGFWEVIHGLGVSRTPAATLFFGPRRRVWKAIASAGESRLWTDESEIEAALAPAPDLEAIHLLEEAVENGVLSSEEFALIVASRVSGEPVSELARHLGARRETISMRRRRAELRFAKWLKSSEGELAPAGSCPGSSTVAAFVTRTTRGA